MRPAESSSVKFTHDDFVNFPNDGKRHEIIDGEHYVTPSPSTRHQLVSMNVTRALNRYLDHHPRGLLFAAPFDVVLSDFDIVEPDLLYISRERYDVLTRQNVRGAPDLVVEILSPSTRKTDETTKRTLYERFGVAEYWVVDPELETIKIHRRAEGVFAQVAEEVAAGSDILATPLLPGFSATFAEIFATPVQ